MSKNTDPDKVYRDQIVQDLKEDILSIVHADANTTQSTDVLKKIDGLFEEKGPFHHELKECGVTEKEYEGLSNSIFKETKDTTEFADRVSEMNNGGFSANRTS